MQDFDTLASALLMVAVLCARIGAALAVFPLFSVGALPPAVRITLLGGFGLCLLPMLGLQQATALARLDGVSLGLLLAKEMMLGLGLGLVGSMAFWAVHAAGAIIANQAGLAMAATLDPLSAEEDALLGGFLVQLLSVLFLASGGLLSLLGVLYESFRVWPVAQAVPSIDAQLWLDAAQQAFRLVAEMALRVAAPFVLLMLMVELGLGLFGRYAPQLNVFFLALPLKAAVLLVLLLLYTATLTDGGLLLPDVAGAMRRLLAGG